MPHVNAQIFSRIFEYQFISFGVCLFRPLIRTHAYAVRTWYGKLTHMHKRSSGVWSLCTYGHFSAGQSFHLLTLWIWPCLQVCDFALIIWFDLQKYNTELLSSSMGPLLSRTQTHRTYIHIPSIISFACLKLSCNLRL